MHQRTDRRPNVTARRWVAATLASVLVLTAACGGDDDTPDASEAASADDTQPAGGDDLLGPEQPAAGEAVRIGLVSDGQAAAFDATTEIRAAQATVDYWNAHRGGIAGRPIELVVCETAADPAKGTDCANRMVEEHVVAVVVGQSTVPDAIWEPLHQAAVPTMFFQTNGEAILADAETSFVLSNPLTTAFGLPISVAEDTGADNVAFVVIDIPVAVDLFESLGPPMMENAGLDYELVKVPLGTADMTAQMGDIVDEGAGVVQVVGNDGLCIAAAQGLAAVGYEGEVTIVSQCLTDATREALAGDLMEGMYVTSGVAVDAAGDPTYDLYAVVMEAFGDDVEIESNVSVIGYTVTAALATALEGLTGEVTPATVTQAIRAMDEAELPAGGGVMFRCDGTAMSSNPALCSNWWLRTTLDSEGNPDGYEAIDSTELLDGL